MMMSTSNKTLCEVNGVVAESTAGPSDGKSSPRDSCGKWRIDRTTVIATELLISTRNLRDLDDGEEMAWLVASVQNHEQLQPICVGSPIDGKYPVIFGHRRLAALRRAGIATAKCVIVEGDVDSLSVEVLQFTENHFRKQLNPIEQAGCFKSIVDRMTAQGKWHKRSGSDQGQTAVAAELGLSQEFVSRRLSLLRLDSADQQAVADGKMTIKAAEAKASAIASRTKKPGKTNTPSPTMLDELAALADESCRLATKSLCEFHDRKTKVAILVNPDGALPTVDALLAAAQKWLAKLQAHAKSLDAE